MLVQDYGILNYFSFDPAAQALINRMIAAGETPTTARQTAINNCIVSLKANSLFNTQFDVLVVTRGTGLASTKMNWIANQYNAVGVPNGGTLTYTADVGYHTDATNSYINTKYTPSTNGVLYTLTDACYGFKVGGSIGAPGVMMGFYTDLAYIGTLSWYGAAGSYVRLNAERSDPQPGNHYEIGYNMISRTSSTTEDVMINTVKTPYAYSSTTYLPSSEIYVLNWDYPGVQLFVSTTEQIELYFFGKSMSQAQFNIFQTIMNTYFATF